ncbi:MAG: tetratricopeptide repeat protein, partial [Myxococcales bacterium]|nr:tetratricopeptide repeat protein [Myxococcales bacterium]
AIIDNLLNWDFVAANLLGELRLASGDDAGAEEQFRKAMEINPGWAIPYRNLSALYLKNGKRDEALALMKQGIEATGGSSLLVTGLAGLYERSGDLDLAIAEYEKVLATKPDSALAANNLAMVLAEYRGDQESLERARELVRPLRNSSQPAFLDTVGWVEYKLGDFAEAQLFLEKAVEAAPDAGLLHYHLGMAAHAAGNEVGAREHLRRALDLGREFKGSEEAERVLAELGEE